MMSCNLLREQVDFRSCGKRYDLEPLRVLLDNIQRLAANAAGRTENRHAKHSIGSVFALFGIADERNEWMVHVRYWSTRWAMKRPAGNVKSNASIRSSIPP